MCGQQEDRDVRIKLCTGTPDLLCAFYAIDVPKPVFADNNIGRVGAQFIKRFSTIGGKFDFCIP